MIEGPSNIERVFRASAILVVFLISFSIPVGISFAVQEDARNMRIKMDMEQLRNWGEVYHLENKSYRGMENDDNIKKVFADIKEMKGATSIFVGKDHNSYCVKAIFRKGSWCVDNTGHAGKDDGVCSQYVTKCD